MPALQEIARRAEPLSMDQGRLLGESVGWDFALRLCRVRETYLPSPIVKFTLRYRELPWRCAHCRHGDDH
jgi:hypothetical protein